MYPKENAIKLVEILKEYYPDAKCSLNFNTPFELLIATILSAQCTDDRVNRTTPTLFAKYHTPEDFSNIDINDIHVAYNAIIYQAMITGCEDLALYLNRKLDEGYEKYKMSFI